MKFFGIFKKNLKFSNYSIKVKKSFCQKYKDHYPVMHKEIIDIIKSKIISYKNDKLFYLADLTLGCGNHTKLILDNFPNCKVVGLDIDKKMIDYCNVKLNDYIKQGRLSLVNDNFVSINEIELNNHFPEADERQLFNFVLLDLGYNSIQLNEMHRGISYKLLDSDLDMRLNQSNLTVPRASDILNNATELELYEIFKNFSEEKNTQRLVANIINYRIHKKFLKVKDLIDVIEETVKHKKVDKISTLNRVFQGLRICVNYELFNLENFFPNSIESVEDNGIVSIISFHSLEDKTVKFYFSEYEKIKRCKLLFKHSMQPSQEEINDNPNSKSAKLRAFIVKDDTDFYSS
jgi:16S rRNA (cytosine1402-N4)-methyltransferase